MRRMIFALSVALLFSAASPSQAQTDPSRDISMTVPMLGNNGNPLLLQARVCRPATDAPARLVVINHGTDTKLSKQQAMSLHGCNEQVSQWFLSRGYVVAYVMRRGFGTSGGSYQENISPCGAENYAHAGLQAARDIDATVEELTKLPYVRQDGVVVVGHSGGGWAADAYDSVPHPKVIALISFAGGHGGHNGGTPNHNCRADQLALAAGMYGKTATTPMLWVYAANDSEFSPAIASDMHQHFTEAGGKAELIAAGPFGNEGHMLFWGPNGTPYWTGWVERYLAQQNAKAN